jgi:glutamate-1-semialdehyde 2,1-aminomutase
MLVERLPSAKQVRFTASGTESTMLAMRAARAFTGRPLVAKFEGGYHGLNDYAMVSVAPALDQAGPAEAPRSVGTPGVPPGTVESMVVLPFNDPAAVEAIVAKHKDRLAGIIVEPLLGAAGTILPKPGFLEFLREITRRNGMVLIFDEVISFRLAWGGAQSFYGVTPDLTTLGKIIGGGYPIGGIAGRAEIMALFDPTRAGAITLSGTFHANPVALVAGIATLKLLTADAIAAVNRRTERFAAAAAAILKRAALPLRIQSVGSLFNIHATAEPVTDYRAVARSDKEFLKLLHLSLLNEGVLLSPRGLGCFSVPMTDADVEFLLRALEQALAATGALRAVAAAEA